MATPASPKNIPGNLHLPALDPSPGDLVLPMSSKGIELRSDPVPYEAFDTGVLPRVPALVLETRRISSYTYLHVTGGGVSGWAWCGRFETVSPAS